MKLESITGNIINYIRDFDEPKKLHVGHGANCYHRMGAGVAKVLNEFTNGGLLEADKKSPYGDINKLGKFSKLIEENRVRYYNCYTQHSFMDDKGGVHIHWNSVESAVNEIISDHMENGDTLFLPAIGTGLAGGEKEDLMCVLEHLRIIHNQKPITVVVFSL